ncbi:hypothetical protein Y032_0049g1768 [Ancylostoma ceylanicum]|nr:hypothetical protein Y032_0049g1768 [Ancylostoma ceylanicum]
MSSVDEPGDVSDISGTMFTQTKEFQYLGSLLSADEPVGAAIRGTITCAWLKWRESTGILCDRRCSRVLKGKVCRTVVRPALLYGSECWPVSKTHERMLNTAEIRMLRWACGFTRCDRVRNEDIRTMMQTVPIQLKLREQRLRWYGHVMRRPSHHPIRRALEMEGSGKRSRGAPMDRCRIQGYEGGVSSRHCRSEHARTSTKWSFLRRDLRRDSKGCSTKKETTCGNGKSATYAQSTYDSHWRINRSHLYSPVIIHSLSSLLPSSPSKYTVRLCSKAADTNNRLSHVSRDGSAKQVDISHKPISHREAVAEGRVLLTPELVHQIKHNLSKKGDVLNVARIASVMGAKLTANIIPLCHSIPISYVNTDFRLDESQCVLHIRTTARTTSNTGIEMEALTACSVAALTVYDMCKAVTQKMVISEIRLVSKTGGKTEYKAFSGF